MPSAAQSACINKTALLSYLSNARNRARAQDAYVIIQPSGCKKITRDGLQTIEKCATRFAARAASGINLVALASSSVNGHKALGIQHRKGGRHELRIRQLGRRPSRYCGFPCRAFDWPCACLWRVLARCKGGRTPMRNFRAKARGLVRRNRNRGQQPVARSRFTAGRCRLRAFRIAHDGR